ncbi:hypothetical protein TCAL_17233 [Tigriopus californicus]|uniref:Uncharacterized protein n=1 Tax=Tigriopus californicus TaxID=6832 RepID=A0A553N6T2_TIGCA|nr:hypothetical protein TCAL_17233 [Tigriopus californicus]
MAEAPDNANNDVRTVAKTVVQIPKYSGHPVAIEYKTASGTCTEVWEALNWIQRCESVRGAARWNNEVLLQQAILSLIPSSPADDWYQCELGQDDVSTWEGFRTALTKLAAREMSTGPRRLDIDPTRLFIEAICEQRLKKQEFMAQVLEVTRRPLDPPLLADPDTSGLPSLPNSAVPRNVAKRMGLPILKSPESMKLEDFRDWKMLFKDFSAATYGHSSAKMWRSFRLRQFCGGINGGRTIGTRNRSTGAVPQSPVVDWGSIHYC